MLVFAFLLPIHCFLWAQLALSGEVSVFKLFWPRAGRMLHVLGIEFCNPIKRSLVNRARKPEKGCKTVRSVLKHVEPELITIASAHISLAEEHKWLPCQHSPQCLFQNESKTQQVITQRVLHFIFSYKNTRKPWQTGAHHRAR